MTTDTKRTSLKFLAVSAALLLTAASAVGQQAAPAQGAPADASRKHLAGVKYQSMAAAKDATPTTTPNASAPNASTPTTEQAPADATKRKNGAVVAADFNKRQEGGPLKGIGTVKPADAKTTSDKGIGSAGVPGKAAPASTKAASGKTEGAPIKGVIYK